MTSTANIKFTKAEIDQLIRTLSLFEKVSNYFNILSENEESKQFIKLKEDLIKIKRQLDEGEQQVRNE
jgi:hypothetical protein